MPLYIPHIQTINNPTLNNYMRTNTTYNSTNYNINRQNFNTNQNVFTHNRQYSRPVSSYQYTSR
jgi:hypothetical protein